MMARLRLTTKQVNGGYYKGNRTGSMGRFLKWGTYAVDKRKVRTYVAPENLNEFKVSILEMYNLCIALTPRQLTPFVTNRMDPTPSYYTKQVQKNNRTVTVITSLQGKNYLDLWSQHNEDEPAALLKQWEQEQRRRQPTMPQKIEPRKQLRKQSRQQRFVRAQQPRQQETKEQAQEDPF